MIPFGHALSPALLFNQYVGLRGDNKEKSLFKSGIIGFDAGGNASGSIMDVYG